MVVLEVHPQRLVHELRRLTGRGLPVAVDAQPIGLLDGRPADVQPLPVAMAEVRQRQAGKADAGPGMGILQPLYTSRNQALKSRASSSVFPQPS